MKEFLKIGLIQPVIDSQNAWGNKPPYQLNISPIIAERVWEEITTGLAMMLKQNSSPDIILIPELHLPLGRIAELKEISKKYGVLIIAGVDFQQHPQHPQKIRNRGIITIPNHWREESKTNRLTTLHFGKSYFTYMERQMFHNINGSFCSEDPEQNMYILQSKEFGNFGLVICSDIFDIERMMFYQGRIHHLFIISLNKDLNTYFSMAETLTRLLYCNVVVCNTGYFGGSLAVSPYDDPNERTIYKYHGQRMFNTHIIDLPVKSLDKAQQFDYAKGDKKKEGIKFKASPPGYRYSVPVPRTDIQIKTKVLKSLNSMEQGQPNLK